MHLIVCIIFYLIFCNKIIAKAITEKELQEARRVLNIINEEKEIAANRATLAVWDYETNLTQENSEKLLQAEAKEAIISKKAYKQAIKFNWQEFPDESLKAQFKSYTNLGEAALSEEKLNRLIKARNQMTTIYSTTKICSKNTKKKNEPCNLSLDPEITELMKKSRDPEELKYLWLEWRNAIGPKCRDFFKEYVDLSNEAAKLNNFSDYSGSWLHEYGDANFKNVVQYLWEQLKPIYVQIHAYVRTKLREKYGDIVSEKGPIPAHLLGNMWAQSWNYIADFMLPYPNVNKQDITAELKRQNYTATKIFKTAESFFTSIGLSPMPETFWKYSMLVKPKGGEVVCHPSAYDFFDRKHFRIKQCTEVTEGHFITAHHEMGHIQYFIQYKDQPYPFRNGANDGFHEAIGDLMALSVQSVKHLKKLELVSSKDEDPRKILNNLFMLGLDKICFLPFGYLIDLWRWDVFSGKIKPEEYNCKWWKFREDFQGLEPPVDRSESDFDPAAKYHIVDDVPYLRYFIAFVLQYQFHRSLCEKAGEYQPNNPKKELHECDIYENKVAGEVLKRMLKMGSSRPWPDALEVMTGQRTMDASALLEYFKPLHKWLANENRKNGAFIGWEKSKKKCIPKSSSTLTSNEEKSKSNRYYEISIGYFFTNLFIFLLFCI